MPPSNTSLVGLVHEITEIERQLIQGEGQLSPEIEALFDLTTGAIKDKVDRYKFIMDAMDARSVYFKDLSDQMTSARRLFENQKNRLKENLKYAMTNMDTTELEGHDWRFKLSRLKDKVVIDQSKLPSEYMKDEVIRVVDKDAIESALMLGETIPGVTTEPSTQLRPYVNPAGRAKTVKEIRP